MSSSDAAAGSETGLKKNVYNHFQQQVVGSRMRTIHSLSRSTQLIPGVLALNEQIDRLKDSALADAERGVATDNCLAGISGLSNEAKDASTYTPVHDQRTYSEVHPSRFPIF